MDFKNQPKQPFDLPALYCNVWKLGKLGFMLCFAWHPQFPFPNAVKKKFKKKKDLKRTFLLKYIIFLHLYDCWCISFQYCHIPNAGPESALEHLVKIRIFHPKCIILSENVSEGRRRIFSNTSRVMDKTTAD